MPKHEAPLNGDLSSLEEEAKELADDDPYYNRVERNFGDMDKEDVFVQSRKYSVFMFTDGVVSHGDFEGVDSENDDLLALIEQRYDSPRGGYIWE